MNSMVRCTLQWLLGGRHGGGADGCAAQRGYAARSAEVHVGAPHRTQLCVVLLRCLPLSALRSATPATASFLHRHGVVMPTPKLFSATLAAIDIAAAVVTANRLHVAALACQCIQEGLSRGVSPG